MGCGAVRIWTWCIELDNGFILQGRKGKVGTSVNTAWGDRRIVRCYPLARLVALSLLPEGI